LNLNEVAESNLTKFDTELVRNGKATKEEPEEFQKYNKNLFDYSFLSLG
jgi:hypothetical protein